MTDHDPDQEDVLKELDLALQVEPSTAFADGVRARVNRSRANTARVWWSLAAAASIGLATFAVWRPSTSAPANDMPVQVAVAPTQATVPSVPTKSPESVVAIEQAPPPVARREATVARTTVTTGRDRGLENQAALQVITNQGAVLRQLWADAQGRPLSVVEGEQVVDGLSAKPIEVNPIVVPPIVVVEMGKEPGPAGATPIIRRAGATRETR